MTGSWLENRLFLRAGRPFAAIGAVLVALVLWPVAGRAEEPIRGVLPAPEFSNVPYGSDPRQVMDFWKADGEGPRPAVVFFHGGGWVKGDKRDVRKIALRKLLSAGISVVSVNYRFTTQAQEAGVVPPVEWPLRDAARAFQFVRSKAAEWHVEPKRLAVSGQSAGGCSSLWLAFHEDLAEPNSLDPVARESTRPQFVAVSAAQTTLDPKAMREWTPNSCYGGHAFGFFNPRDLDSRDRHFAAFFAHRDEILPAIRAYSPFEHVSGDDPAVYLIYEKPPALGKAQGDPTHSANFGVKLQEKLQASGVDCELVYPGAPGVRHGSLEESLIAQLNQ